VYRRSGAHKGQDLNLFDVGLNPGKSPSMTRVLRSVLLTEMSTVEGVLPKYTATSQAAISSFVIPSGVEESLILRISSS
jgi:hypothetical protein